MTASNNDRHVGLGFTIVSGLGVMLIFLALVAWFFIVDRLPYLFRTLVASIGLDEELVDLLEDLNHARGKMVACMDPPGLEDYDESGELFETACYACWNADLAPWRIKLAGGPHAMRLKPHQP